MKEAGLKLLKLLAISTVLVTIGDLSWKVWLAVGLIFFLSMDWEPSVFFTPHSVWFGADIGKLLVDIGYVSPEAWATYKDEKYGQNELCSMKTLVHDGLQAFVLSVDDEKKELIHWPQCGQYTSELFFEEKLEIPCADELSPFFFVRPKGDFYLIGVSVSRHWWERVQNDLPKTGLKSVEFLAMGRAYLVLAAFPQIAFDQYYRREDQKADEKAVAAVEAAGFTKAGVGWKNELVSVWVRAIPTKYSILP